MKLPISWLKDFVNIGDATPEKLSELLLGIGFEVEEIIYCGEKIENVVAAKIISIRKHENSDHLHICLVDVGTEVLQIVCGAPNIHEGDVVPCALAGAKLPGGEIRAGEIRGVRSYGMLCSGSELGIDDNVIDGAEVNGLLQLPKNTKIGKDIKDVLGLNEYVLDISITANRPDCQSIVGISREIAAALGAKFTQPEIGYKTSKIIDGEYCPTVEIQSDICSRYTGRLIRDVKIKKSPKWMRDRLRMVGIRSINNIVDITNYVLIEIGQPLHSFDDRFIENGIIVREASDGEKITALDGKEYVLDSSMLVIADHAKPIAIAGVMGGEYSGIMHDTKNVFLEAANFERSSIRKTSKKLGLRSDSSARYEKGVDYLSIDTGRERALTLISKLNAGTIVDYKADAGIAKPSRKVIRTTPDKINSILGIDIKKSKIISILKALQIDVSNPKDDQLICTIPLFREDIEDYADLSEEVMRYYGYDNLVPSFFKNAENTIGGIDETERKIQDVKKIMTGLGCDECMNYSFICDDFADKLRLEYNDWRREVLRLCNPLNKDTAVMRTQLVSCMLGTLALNISRGNEDLSLFELGRIYIPKGSELPVEKNILCIGLSGDYDFYTIKGMVDAVLDYFNFKADILYSSQRYLHPGKSGEYRIESHLIASFGEIHPSVAEKYELNRKCYIAEIDLDYLINKADSNKKYSTISKFPRVVRDLAFTVKDEVSVGDIIKQCKAICGCTLEDITLFDIYKGEQIAPGMKSLAFKYKFRLNDRTLNDSEIQEMMNKIIDSLEKNYGAEIRK